MIAFALHCLLAALLGARSIACPPRFVLSQGVRADGTFTCSRFATRIDDDGEALEVLRGWPRCDHAPTMDLTATVVRCAP